MFLATHLATMVCLAGTSPAELDSIGSDVVAAWREDGPARNLRVQCRFDLKVERSDEALSDRYFPNTFIPYGTPPRQHYRVGPQTKWIEDVATRGDKYRN